jgi:hypothetical protein
MKPGIDGARYTSLSSDMGLRGMPLHRLLDNHAFGPDEIVILTTAFEGALKTLQLIDRTDPATEMVARKIIQLAGQGVRDPEQLRQMTVRSRSSSD